MKSLFTKKTNELEKKSNPFWSQAFGDFGNGNNQFSSDSQELKAYSNFAYVSIAADNLMKDAGGRDWWFEDNDGKMIDLDRVEEAISTPFINGYAESSITQILSNIVGHRSITGNGYLWITEQSAFGMLRNIPEVFIPLSPACVKPLLTNSGLFLRGYEVDFAGNKKIVEPNKIIHFRQNALTNPWIGMGNVEKARTMYATEFKKDQFEQNFFKKGASPSMIITEETERNPEDIERIIDIMQKKYSGSENAGKMMYMAGKGINANALQLSQKDMEFLDQKKYNADTILKLFGVPPTVAGSETANRATAEIARLQYLQSTINPIIKDMETTINRQFVHKVDGRVNFKMKMHNTGDIEAVVKKLQNGIITPNMASQALGEEVAEGDETRNTYYMPSSYLPIGFVPEVVEEPVAEDTEDDKCGCGTDHKADINDPHNWEVICKAIDENRRGDGRKWQVNYLRAALKARVRTEDNYTVAMEKFYTSQKNRVVKAIIDNSEKIEKEIAFKKINPLDTKALEDNIMALIFNLNEENDIVRKEIRPLHTSALTKAVHNANDIAGSSVNPSLSNPFVANRIDQLGKNIVGSMNTNGQFISVNATTQKAISKIVLKAVVDDLPITEMTEMINLKLGGEARLKARRIARSESRIAYDAGSKIAYKELGVKYVDVIGCEQLEPDSDCGRQKVPIDTELSFHPNHIGAIVPHDEP